MPGRLYAREIAINDKIVLRVPTVGEVLDASDCYYQTATMVVSTPYDMMVQLDDAGIDFTKITAFDLFCLLFQRLAQSECASLIFGDLDLSKFEPTVNPQNGNLIWCDKENDIVIDSVLHDSIANELRAILGVEKHDKRPGNEEARLYMLKQARKKQKRAMREKQSERLTLLEKQIVSLVCTEKCPYDYESIRNITLLQFNYSFAQISHLIHYNDVMIGYYSGAIKATDLKPEEKTWVFTSK